MKKPNSTVNHIQIATSIQERRPVIGLLRVTSASLIGLALAVGVLALTRPVVVRGAGPWYVATTGSPANNCLGPATPCDTLQRAIDLASAGDTINVAAGTYTVASGNEVATVSRALTFSGGWNAAFTTQTGSSVIDGQNARRGLTIVPGAATTLTNFVIQNGLATSGVYTTGAGIGAGSNSPVTLINVNLLNNAATGAGGGLFAASDVNVTGGLVQGNTCSGCYGAGISTGGGVIVSGTQFINNTGALRGGAIDAFLALSISNAAFQGNTSTGFGGAVYGDGAVTVTDSTFTANVAGYQGGALYAFGQATLTRVTVSNNVATDEGGGMAFNAAVTLIDSVISQNLSQLAAGGGLATRGAATLTNTDLLSNTALTRGGGIYAASSLNVVGAAIRANTADRGGGVAVDSGGVATITGSTLVGNLARMEGGGLVVLSATPGSISVTLDNNFIAANDAVSEGDEVAFHGPAAASVTGRHNTFAATTPGSGLAISLGVHAANETLSLTNSIFDGYALGVDSGALASTTTVNGVLWSNVTVPTQTALGPIVVGNAFTGAAAFVNRAVFDLHVADGTAAFNRGVATALTTDIDGDTRPLYGVADLGADELDLSTNLVLTQSAAPVVTKPGDPITFTLTYTNAGARIAYAPAITDSIPTASLTDIAFTSSGAAITATGGLTYTWQIANLAPGAGGTITVTARVSNGFTTPAALGNSALIESWVGDPLPANNTAAASVQVEAPITGLQAQSSSPQPPSTAVAFTATVSAGSNVTYAWSFGDGGTGSGAQSSHAYAAIGAYTATVTATNPLGSAVVQIPVTIADLAITGLAINGPATTPVNKATNYAATVTAGSNVTYAWQIDGAAAGSGATVPLTFSTTGSHTVTVTATNTAGSQFATLVVTVVPNRLYFPTVSK